VCVCEEKTSSPHLALIWRLTFLDEPAVKLLLFIINPLCVCVSSYCHFIDPQTINSFKFDLTKASNNKDNKAYRAVCKQQPKNKNPGVFRIYWDCTFFHYCDILYFCCCCRCCNNKYLQTTQWKEEEEGIKQL
jgi:hypothetical protein